MSERKYGFIALWKHSDRWYAEEECKKEKFVDRVNEIIKEAQDKGVTTSSVYDCSWSSEWRYFSFWECPSIEVLQDTIQKLITCGDVNVYNIQRHFIGREVLDNDIIDTYDPHMFDA